MEDLFKNSRGLTKEEADAHSKIIQRLSKPTGVYWDLEDGKIKNRYQEQLRESLSLLRKLLDAAHKLDEGYLGFVHREKNELSYADYEYVNDTFIEIEEYLQQKGIV